MDTEKYDDCPEHTQDGCLIRTNDIYFTNYI